MKNILKLPFKNKKTIAVSAILLLFFACCVSKQHPEKDLFGVYAAQLDGSKLRMILSDPARQMTHARPSPDGKWLVFTRYNKKDFGGIAEEEGGYAQTEIAIAQMDGSNIRTIIPPKDGVIAANGNWSKDGRSIVYISTDNPQGTPELKVIDLQTMVISKLAIPENLKPSDPDWNKDFLVFPSKAQPINPLWIMSLDGKTLRQLTYPSGFEGKSPGPFSFGDYDPKISPDGTKVAFMRFFGGEIWKTYVVDIASGQEKLITFGEGGDGVPEWSSDGRLLAFWHADRKNLPSMGIYTMRPDGSDRKLLPLPRGYLHGHPVFFPNSGSDANAQIIFVAKKFPQLP